MNTLQIQQIKRYFDKEYTNLINVEDVPENQKHTTFLSWHSKEPKFFREQESCLEK